MMRIGLRPISSDKPGKMTGNRVTHEIVPGGRFDVAADKLLATGFQLKWQSANELVPGSTGTIEAAVPNRNKVKYTCPTCDQNAWAKPAAHLNCGWCREPMLRSDGD